MMKMTKRGILADAGAIEEEEEEEEDEGMINKHFAAVATSIA